MEIYVRVTSRTVQVVSCGNTAVKRRKHLMWSTSSGCILLNDPFTERERTSRVNFWSNGEKRNPPV
uniref:Bm13046 n=1 Tax=Brugia malayi TaxID=6279 RepID=A0A1I9GF27_BRUMA|nr:Bm13046 [Brugia malayi]